MVSRLTIRAKMLVVLASVAIASSGITALLGYRIARQAVEEQSFEKLVAVREIKANQVEDYIGAIADQIVTLAESRMIVDAMIDFRESFAAVPRELRPDESSLTEADGRLRSYYEREYLTRLREAGEREVTTLDVWPSPVAARLLQAAYIADNQHEVGEKHLLLASQHGTRYDDVHRRYHPLLRNFLERFGYYDIFLIDADSGDIVYSVFKEVDFATSLETGPYRDSNFAEVFVAARDSGESGFTRLVDFEPYEPSYDAPASFIATPVFDAGKLIGVLAFQMPVDRINDIMTSRQEWARVGLGKTGETYIVGGDLTLRNQSRFLIEERESYLQAIEQSGTSPTVVRRIASLGTSIGLQEVRTKGTLSAAAGVTGLDVFRDYRGVPVLSAYRPLDLRDLDWSILSEIDRAEALAPARRLRNQSLLVLAILVLLIVGIAVVFSRSLTTRLRALAAVAGQLAGGTLDVEMEADGNDEISDLARSFESMRQSLVDLVERQEREIQALAVPLIPLRDDVVAMPLVGELEPRRLQRVREALVEGLHASGARAVLLDMTGVPYLSPESAEALVTAARAAQLLGVRVVLTGMQARVASDLAELNVNLDGIETERSLESGVRAALGSVPRRSEQFSLEEEQEP